MYTILQGVVGSTAYNLDTPTSDLDRLAIYVEETEKLFGFHPEKVAVSLQEHDPDVTSHEVGKFLSLALKANPSILEFLWLPKYEVRTPWGHYVQINRNMFLSKHVKSSYGGYVIEQVKRIERRIKEDPEGYTTDKRVPKHARHCFRLLLQGGQLLQHKDMQVALDNDARCDAFALGELAQANFPEFKKEMLDELAHFDALAAATDLPDEPDRAATEYLLKQVRMAYLPPPEELVPHALDGLEMLGGI